jgi:hypothetical protein
MGKNGALTILVYSKELFDILKFSFKMNTK